MESQRRPSVIIFVIVYNRVDNIKRWISCWKQGFQRGATIHIIKNSDGQTDEEVIRLCKEAEIPCTLRQNIGFDIGAFQDVCMGRLDSEPFDAMIWVADDMAPMKKEWWLHIIYCLMSPGVGIASTHVSWEYRKHCRTSGFAIRKETAVKLVFPADPITTKDECYDFEHRGNTLHDQVVKMGLQVLQVSQRFDDLLWDTDHFKYLTENLLRFNSVFSSGNFL